MLQLKAYKTRFYPSKVQEEILNKTFGCIRFVWNNRVFGFNNWDKENPVKDLTIKEMKVVHEWLSEVPYNALEQKLQDWITYKKQHFSKTRKSKVGRPHFKIKGNHESFRLSSNGFRFKDWKLVASKIGVLKLSGLNLKDINTDSCKSVTISRNPSGQYHVSILVQEEIQPLERVRKTVGIDLGLTHFAILSDGTKIENPRMFRENQSKLKKAQQHLSRKTKGSASYKKQRTKVARVHLKIKNQRNHFLHKLSTKIIRNYDTICTENLKVKNMVKNRKLSKSISDASWSSFISMLKYKSNWYGRTFTQVDTFFASSKMCSCCGTKVESLPLNIREWKCSNCGTSHDRDLNAATNILNRGLTDLYSFTSDELADYKRREEVSL